MQSREHENPQEDHRPAERWQKTGTGFDQHPQPPKQAQAAHNADGSQGLQGPHQPQDDDLR